MKIEYAITIGKLILVFVNIYRSIKKNITVVNILSVKNNYVVIVNCECKHNSH